MKKNVVLVCVAIVAVGAIGYFAINGFPPTGQGAQGTVGAAVRHQSGQITKGDVALDNPDLQAFMQTDVYDKIIEGPAAPERPVEPGVPAGPVERGVPFGPVERSLPLGDVERSLPLGPLQRGVRAGDVRTRRSARRCRTRRSARRCRTTRSVRALDNEAFRAGR